MKEKIVSALKFSVFLAIGILLLWLVYRDVPMSEIMKTLRDFDYFWVFVSFIVSILSHVSRAMRWKILLKTMNYNPRLSNTFFAVMVMYLSNLAFPRMGEVTRCAIMKKYENVSLSKAFGTVFLERMVDLFLLLVLLLIVVITQFSVVKDFVNNNPSVYEKFLKLWSYKYIFLAVAIAGLGSLVALFMLRHKFSKFSVYSKVSEVVKSFREGVFTIINMKEKWSFFFHSVFIYAMYFLMIYTCFQGFDHTDNLSVMAGITVFVISSLGMVAPVNGGIGAWHFMAREALFVYGVTRVHGAAFALIAHSAMTLTLVVAGFISLIMLPIVNRKPKQVTA